MVTSLELLADADLGAGVGELYAGDPAAFVATRAALQREARAGGRRDLATAIGRLRKPTVAEHALNQLARSEDAVLLADVRARHEEATVAQAAAITGDADARLSLRSATTAARAARAAAVAAAVRRAGPAVGDQRAAAIEAVLQRVVEGERWDELLSGVLGADALADGTPADDPVFRGIAPDARIPSRPASGAARSTDGAATGTGAEGGGSTAVTRTGGTARQADEARRAGEAERARLAELVAADAGVRAAAEALATARAGLEEAAAALEAATGAHRAALREVREAERAHDAAVLGRERLAAREPARRRRP